MLPIITAPNVTLSQVSKPVRKIDGEIITLIEEMKETLSHTHDPEGVGLAAPQVGRSLQLFIIKPTQKSKVQVFINPEISLSQTDEEQDTKKTKDNKLEGCLSLPQIWGTIKRHKTITVTYVNEKGKQIKKTFSGFLAVVIQHEYDHLQGVLFPKRVLDQKGKLYKSHKNDKGEDEFDEINL